MSEKPEARTFRSGEWKGPRAPSTRRDLVRLKTARARGPWWEAVRRPDLARMLLTGIGFALIAGAMIAWTREQPNFAQGRVARETRLVRIDFDVIDNNQTERQRDLERARAPRVYVADRAVFEEVQRTLLGLPTSLADAATVDQVALEIVQAFGLTQPRLDAVRRHVVDGAPDQAWQAKVAALLDQLRETPLVDAQTYQIEHTQANDLVELRSIAGPAAGIAPGPTPGAPGGAGSGLGVGSEPRRVPDDRIVNIEIRERAEPEVRRCVRLAGFTEPLASMIVERLMKTPRATYVFDEAATEVNRDRAAAATPPVAVRQPAGEKIVEKGRPIDEETHVRLLDEHRAFMAKTPALALWAPRAGSFAFASLLTVAGAVYIALFSPRIRRSAGRVFGVAVLMLLGLAAAAIGSAANPSLMPLLSVTLVTQVAVALAIAYDQRTALAFSALLTALVAAALGASLGTISVAMAGAAAAVWRLKEIRHRNSIIYAGLVAGAAMAITRLAVTPLDMPVTEAVWRQAIFDAMWAALGGVLVGFITLGILPTLERTFDMLTGMTLIELRDPKQPLLRELQQRAPGTYQHSFTVATLAENAAEAIGADGLHLYVGALYHDIGKMNKPDYFVENQSGPFSRHAKLSPAMSLLVIVGHVKDGVELAREYGLPRSLHHYVESHHGTTLVEYFYHAAQQKAETEAAEGPKEIEYRYPGPKPRTREAAILMICDAVESATRAMSDPTPSRIETLVHELAMRRLMDGQFDDSELTLRELHIVEASLVKTLCSIYHGRIAYPTGGAGGRDEHRPPTAPIATGAGAPAAEKTA